MAKIGFTVSTPDGGGADLGDLLVPRDLFSEGGLWGFGDNSLATLGDSTTANKSSPIQTLAGGTNWKQVACGQSHSTAIKTDGSLWCFGYNGNGQLGDNTITNRSSPVQTIALGTSWRQVSGGQFHTAAIKTDGSLWSWGSGGRGQLGDSTITSGRSSPIQTIAAGNNWKQVACGNSHTAAIKTDGSLWIWGYNNIGQLGDSTLTNRSSPIQTIAGGNNWKQVACGSQHTAAIKNDGSLWSWGINSSGQLGDSTLTNNRSPVQTISGGNNWKYVFSGCISNHTAAIKNDGSLWSWGDDTSGQLGDSQIISNSSPVQTIAGGYNWKQVACGNLHTAAIKTDGSLWLWGFAGSGQLGDSTQVSKSSPVQTLAGGTNWKQVGCASSSTLAVKDDM